jgi:hypothetical protein
MSVRPVLVAACLVAALAFAPSAAADKRSKRQPPRAFIEASAIVAPERVGEFVLEGSQQWPDQKFAGVQFRYLLPGHEALRIDVFVYPHGDMPQARAIETGLRDFLDTLDAQVRAGNFSDFQVLNDAPMTLPRFASSVAEKVLPAAASEAPAGTAEGRPKDTAPAQAAAASEAQAGDASDPADADPITALLADAAQSKGRRLALSYRIADPDIPSQRIEMRSMGYLFYKQLYLFKGRISAAASQIGEAEFQALTDRAMRELIPAIQVFNAGGCAQVAINVDPDKLDGDSADSIALDLVAAMNAKIERNCGERLDTPEFKAASRDAEVRRVDYDPEDWGGGP